MVMTIEKVLPLTTTVFNCLMLTCSGVLVILLNEHQMTK